MQLHRVGYIYTYLNTMHRTINLKFIDVIGYIFCALPNITESGYGTVRNLVL
jgi:hypothetical protein